MKPEGLVFKGEGIDKYGKLRQGELMLVHQCLGCGKISINRIAGDDEPKAILKVFDLSQKIGGKEIKLLKERGIKLLSEKNKKDVVVQLFGKKF